MLHQISMACHSRRTRSDICIVVAQKRTLHLTRIKPAYHFLKAVATSMLAIRAGSVKRLADHRAITVGYLRVAARELC